MSDESALPVCHLCENEEAELILNIPTIDGEQPACRRCLRRIDREVDARTWLKTGYAEWLLDCGTHAGEPLPREPKRPEDQRLREELDERMGWYDA